MFQSRFLIAIFLTAITVVGVAAGAKVALMEAQQKAASPQTFAQDDDFENELLTVAKTFYISSTTIADTAHRVASSFGGGVFSTTSKLKFTPPTPAKPIDPVKAEAYLVGDILSGKIYYQKNADEVLPFASMSKIITALVAGDIYSPTTKITITDLETQVPQDASALKSGETFTLKELMYPMLLNSSNVAAEAIGSSTDRVKFLELMSSYAWEIGMPNAFFADPTGLSPRNAGTANGFFAMAQFLFNKHPEILALTTTQKYSVATTSDHGSHDFTSIHPFVTDPRFLGGKTGHTPEAQDTMLTIMNIGGRPIAIIVLKSPNNREGDTRYLVGKISSSLAAN